MKSIERNIVSILTKNGKKKVAFKIIETSIKILLKKKLNPIKVFEQAIFNVTPSFEVKKYKRGNQFLFLPIVSSANRRQKLAIRWLINSAKLKKTEPFCIALSNSVIDAASQKGKAFNQKLSLYKQINL
uniref:Ribosomal protein S7 n=1 Tax=Thraustochytrium aureum TaxID=42467 RepID=Q9G4B5_9STRA|nr:ribosomal protein S7 [Thraustochytrium aureum]